MKWSRVWIVRLCTLVLILTLAFGTGDVFAETIRDIADSDLGQIPPGVTGSFGWEDELGGIAPQHPATPGLADSDTNNPPPDSDGSPIEAQAPNENPVSPTGASLLSPVLSYYLIPGTDFQGKSSNFEYTYDVKGCFHRTSTIGSEQYAAPLHLPNGSVIKFVRLYFVDTNASAGVGGYLTRFEPGVASLDLLGFNNGSWSTGAGSVDSQEITHTVTTETHGYTVLAYTGANSSTVQVCGARVAYYAPAAGTVFLPVLVNK